MKKGITKTYINVMEDMHEGSRTSVKSTCGITEDIWVRVSVHQGSTLSSYLFSVVTDEVTKGIQRGEAMVHVVC